MNQRPATPRKAPPGQITPRQAKLRAVRLRRLKRQYLKHSRRSRPWIKAFGLRLVLPATVLGLAFWQFGQHPPRQASLPTPTTIPSAAPSPSALPLPSPASPTGTAQAPLTQAPPATLPTPLPGQPNPTNPSSVASPSNPPRPASLPSVPRQIPQAVAPTKGPTPEIRVAIAQAAVSLPAGTSTVGLIRDDQGQVLGRLEPNQAVQVQVNPGGGLQVGEVPAPGSVWIQSASGGYVFLEGRWYRGRLRLVADTDGVLAVNYVDLEQYVTSVVGAEVYPTWPIAALKAQAIAARSYAVAHAMRPAHRFFDLGNTQRWQVYQGIEDEWNTTAQATKLTRGVVLSHEGTVMVSMYAATDEIVRDAFDGKGMSQTGAYELASKGYTYLQILGAYYPGAGLAQLRVK